MRRLREQRKYVFAALKRLPGERARFVESDRPTQSVVPEPAAMPAQVLRNRTSLASPFPSAAGAPDPSPTTASDQQSAWSVRTARSGKQTCHRRSSARSASAIGPAGSRRSDIQPQTRPRSERPPPR